MLVLSIPPGLHLPAGAGYSIAALVCTAILTAALAVSLLFALRDPGRLQQTAASRRDFGQPDRVMTVR